MDPAIFLVKMDKSDWLLIQYVPEKAKVREKMLFAASKATLTKELGDAKFTDSYYASVKVILCSSTVQFTLSERSIKERLFETQRAL